MVGVVCADPPSDAQVRLFAEPGAKRLVRCPDGGDRGLASGARVRRRVRCGGHRGPVWRDRRGVFRIRLRRYAGASVRPDGPDDGRHGRALPSDTRSRAVVYDFSHVGYIDTSAAIAIDEIFELAHKNGLSVNVSGLQDQVARVLKGLGVLSRVPPEQCFVHRQDAIESAIARVARHDA